MLIQNEDEVAEPSAGPVEALLPVVLEYTDTGTVAPPDIALAMRYTV
jgi:hypothetical protein